MNTKLKNHNNDEQKIDQDLEHVRPFGGTKTKYFWVSLLLSIWTVYGIYILFGCAQYFFMNDSSIFSLKSFLIATAVFVVYQGLNYYCFLHNDGMTWSKTKYRYESVTVKLPVPEKNPHFG